MEHKKKNNKPNFLMKFKQKNAQKSVTHEKHSNYHSL